METDFDLLLTGGTVVTGAGVQRADVGVRGEQREFGSFEVKIDDNDGQGRVETGASRIA